MKLSIVIICWNDRRVIMDCLNSIFRGTRSTEFEVIVSDNGSTDNSVETIRTTFPQVRVVENRANLGFAKGNNAGIRETRGDYVLILNPDTLVHEGTLDGWLEFADRHPEGGAFGLRVLNPNGSYQESARPFPSLRGDLLAALYLRSLAHLFKFLRSDTYTGWKGDTERKVDWQSGCCVMFRGDLLRSLGGFDEQFFYHYEEVDLCRRVWKSGHPILFTPKFTITHLGGQSVNRFPIRFELERQRSRYRFFYKHFGKQAARRCRFVALARLRVRQAGYGLINMFKPSESLSKRLEMYRVSLQWNSRIDPVRFVETGEEPELANGLVVQRT